jgi:hypothetical protein
LVVALVGSLVHVGAPVRVRFELSRSSLDAFTKTVSDGFAWSPNGQPDIDAPGSWAWATTINSHSG